MGATNKRKGKISDINVTPLVDVMLVLLVIFMIAAPLMFNGIKLRLPKTREVNPIKLKKSQVILSYTEKGELYLGKNVVAFKDVFKKINEAFQNNSADVLYLRADYKLTYGRVARLMSSLKSNGIQNIALVTEIEEKK